MEINLLPKRSFYEQYRLLLIGLPSLLLLTLLLVGSLKMVQLSEDIARVQGDLANVRSENVALQAERTTDTKTQLFHDIQNAVKGVQANEHDYGLMLDGIAAKLSDKTRVTAAAMDSDSQKVTLTLESDSMDSIADYAVLLRAEPWVKDVFVQNIENTTADKQQPGSNQKLSQKLTDHGVEVLNPPPDPGASQQQNYADQRKAEHPFQTQVVITLAPKGVPVQQSSK